MIACVCTNILHIYKPERSVSVANPQTFRKNNYCTVLIEDYIRTLLIGTDTYNYSVFSITTVPSLQKWICYFNNANCYFSCILS